MRGPSGEVSVLNGQKHYIRGVSPDIIDTEVWQAKLIIVYDDKVGDRYKISIQLRFLCLFFPVQD